MYLGFQIVTTAVLVMCNNIVLYLNSILLVSAADAIMLLMLLRALIKLVVTTLHAPASTPATHLF